jgi:predicted ester cyclase
MLKIEKNRSFILKFYKTISGKKKSWKSISQFTTDSLLIEQIIFFEKLIPHFDLVPDEITVEDNRVIVHAQLKGKHSGTVAGFPASCKNISTIIAIGFHIEDKIITDHWFITDKLDLVQQLGLINLSI